MAKKQLDVIESQQQLNEEKSQHKARTKHIYEKLKGEVLRYREMDKKINELNSGVLANTLKSLDSGNPIIMVQFNSSLIKLKVVREKLWQSILVTYIEFLGYTDQLQKRPLINYLSEDLGEIGS
jgi:hypothetical protein